jgi:hypothetical protein
VGGDVTIQEVQDDAMPVGTQIELRGVVITAIDSFGARTGDIWVGEPGGGEFSGVKVFKAPLTAVASLAVGDLVDITNISKDEFALNDDTTGRKVTEVGPVGGGEMTITRIGPGTLPTPATVDAKAIDALAEAARDAEWEKWEGVRINVINARQLDADRTFGDDAEDQHEFHITGGATVETVLAPFHADAVQGVCFTGITGIGDYFFDYLVLPENEAATAGGGTGCDPLPVATVATIPEVQAGTKTGLVELDDVYVVALNYNKKNMWVSSSLTAAANEGMYIYGNGTAFGADIVPGAKVKVTGTVKEFDASTPTGTTLTEITGATVAFVAAPTGTVAPVTGQSVTTLSVAATGEPYESVLVTLTNVKVDSATDNQGNPDYGVSMLSQYPGAHAFKADDDIHLLGAAAAGKCYGTITGIWTYSVYDSAYYFLPLAAGDETDGNCVN